MTLSLSSLILFAIVSAATLVVFLSVVLFAFHPGYKCGFLGAIGLGMIACWCVSRLNELLLDLADGDDQLKRISSRAILISIGLALYIGQLAYRFLRRVRKERPWWYKKDVDPDHTYVAGRR